MKENDKSQRAIKIFETKVTCIDSAFKITHKYA